MSLESEVKRVADALEGLTQILLQVNNAGFQQGIEPPPPAKKPRKKKEEKPAVEETPVNEAPAPEENETAPTSITKEDLRTLAVKVLKKHNAKKGHMLMRKAIEPFGAEKLSDVPEENYVAVYAALSELSA